MKNYIWLIFLFMAQSSFAKNTYTYGIGNEFIIIKKVDTLFINQTCQNKKCLAYEKGLTLKQHRPKKSNLVGGKNPLSVICKNILKGQVFIAKDLEGNNQSLCRFSDNSYLVLR